MIPWKVNNSKIKELNDSEMDEISSNELKGIMIRMVGELRKTCINTWMNSKRKKINS
jgi:hypothetical protein